MAKQQLCLTSFFPVAEQEPSTEKLKPIDRKEQSRDENFLKEFPSTLQQDSSSDLRRTEVVVEQGPFPERLINPSPQLPLRPQVNSLKRPLPPPAPPPRKRVKGVMYTAKGQIVIWSGKRWHCEHNRQRATCTACGGASLCEHDRIRSQCKDCGGTSICEHNRIRSKCKDCGGTSICEHDRIHSQCKDCGGTSICEHDRRRSQCKDCQGGSVCEHKRLRNQCWDCNGTSICEHDRQRSHCKECRGTSICQHDRERSGCKDCGGTSICEHNRCRSKCKDCGGASICKHNRDRFQCSDCGTGLCPICGLYQTKGRLCATCNPNSKTKKRYDESRIEMKMIRFLQERVTWTILSMEQDFGSSCGYKNKRFDCVFYSRTGKIVIVVECDENAHATYPEKCEWTRPFAACDIFQPKPVLFVRWNPDAWKVNGTTIRVSKKQKMEVLWKTIQPYAEEAASSSSSSASSSEFGPLKVISLYYPSITQNPVCKLTKEELEGKMDVLFS